VFPSHDHHGEVVVREKGRTHQATLASAVVGAQNWTTPNARDWKDTPGQKLIRNDGKHRLDQLPRQVHNSTRGKNQGLLSPSWVEQLMDVPVLWTQLPTEWTDSDCLATELCQQQQQEHGQF